MHIPSLDHSFGIPPLLRPWVQRFRKAHPTFEIVAFRGAEVAVVARSRRYFKISLKDPPENPAFVEI